MVTWTRQYSEFRGRGEDGSSTVSLISAGTAFKLFTSACVTTHSTIEVEPTRITWVGQPHLEQGVTHLEVNVLEGEPDELLHLQRAAFGMHYLQSAPNITIDSVVLRDLKGKEPNIIYFILLNGDFKLKRALQLSPPDPHAVEHLLATIILYAMNVRGTQPLAIVYQGPPSPVLFRAAVSTIDNGDAFMDCVRLSKD
jgi:hypothetical protein